MSCDLHIHTYYSDSTSSPKEVVAQAVEQNLKCIAITDHDIIEGVAPTMKEAEAHGIEVIPGIELSTEINGKDIHMLGYLFDYTNEELTKKLSILQDSRKFRMQKMIDKLKEMDVAEIHIDEVAQYTESNALGRPHLAQVLVDKGAVKNIKSAFDKYIAEGQPAYVSYERQTPQEAITLIHEYGGIAVLAHPMVTSADELIPQFVSAGLDGIEVYYPNTTKQITDFYIGLAKKHNLLVTGGSDAHGDAKKHTFVGNIQIPYEIVEQMKTACSK